MSRMMLTSYGALRKSRRGCPRSRASLSVVLLAMLPGAVHARAQDGLRIPAQTPLRIKVSHTIPLHPGVPFAGTLLAPIYGPDRMLLPAGLLARGVVDRTPAADRTTRVWARLDGDFTPLKEPVIRVTQVVLPSGAVLPLNATGNMRNTALITLARHGENGSLVSRAKRLVRDRTTELHDTLYETVHPGKDAPGRSDKLKKLLFAQLPYHPQKLWAGSSFDAVLGEAVEVPDSIASRKMMHAPAVELASGNMHARLTETVSSAAAAKGDAVNAVLTEPFCDDEGRMMLPTGTPLIGVVVQARPARWFARNGRLRFAFRSIGSPDTSEAGAGQPPTKDAGSAVVPRGRGANGARLPVAHPQRRTASPALSTRDREPATMQIEGHLRSIDAVDGQNVMLDQEGGATAQPDKGRLLAPLVLGAFAVASQDDDGGVARQGVTSNGFGVPARVLTMALASRNLSTGFATYAFTKSIYKRWIARGHEVTFPRYTEMSIDLGRR